MKINLLSMVVQPQHLPKAVKRVTADCNIHFPIGNVTNKNQAVKEVHMIDTFTLLSKTKKS